MRILFFQIIICFTSQAVNAQWTGDQREFLKSRQLGIDFDANSPDYISSARQSLEARAKKPFENTHLIRKSSKIQKKWSFEEIEKEYQAYLKTEFLNPVAFETFVLSVFLSKVMPQQLAAFSKFPWIRDKRVHFAYEQFQQSTLDKDYRLGILYFAIKQLYSNNELLKEIKTTLQEARGLKDGFRKLGRLELPEVDHEWIRFNTEPFENINTYKINQNDVLDSLRNLIRKHFSSYSNAGYLVDFAHLQLIDEFIVDFNHYPVGSLQFNTGNDLAEQNELTRVPFPWPKIKIRFNPKNLPKNYEELRKTFFGAMNEVYLEIQFSRIFDLYAMDKTPSYAQEISRKIHFKDEIEPFYEKKKWVRFQKLNGTLLTYRIPIKNQMTEPEAKSVTQRLAWTDQNLNDNSKNLATSFGGKSTDIKTDKKDFSGSLEEMQIRWGPRSIRFNLLANHYAQALDFEDGLIGEMQYPVTFQFLNKELVILVLKDFHLGEMKSLYDVQIQLAKELRQKQEDQVRLKYLKNSLGNSFHFYPMPLQKQEEVRSHFWNGISKGGVRSAIQLAAKRVSAKQTNREAWSEKTWISRKVRRSSSGFSFNPIGF